MAATRVRKPSRPRHFGNTRPDRTFNAAYNDIALNPNRTYRTTGNHRAFRATARMAVRGGHRGQRVIIFRTDGQERARVYKCCWKHRTNCNRTYVDCYVLAL